VANDIIEVPRELITAQYAIHLCIDVMNVNGLVFLTTISKFIKYRTAQFLSSKQPTELLKALGEVIALYKKGGFQVTYLYCDNEFRPLLTLFEQQHSAIHINFANPNEHVPDIERSIRVIKERIRSTYHRLPFYRMTRTMVKVLVCESAKKLNFFPVKGGISPYFSPRMILHQRSLDYSKHCKYSFGSYVQAHDDPSIKNSNAPRTLDCLYLRYADNMQGGHQLLHLQTNSIITRQFLTLTPITKPILRQVEMIAEQENMPAGLKIKNRANNILYDHAWLAGVEYIGDHEDDEEENENENEDDENAEENNEESDRNESESEETESETDSDDDDDDPNNLEREDLHRIYNNRRRNENQLQLNNDDDDNINDPNNVDEDINAPNDEEEEQVDETRAPQPEEAIQMENEPMEDIRTRSGRVSRAPARLNLQQSILEDNVPPQEVEVYSVESARVITRIISMMCAGVTEVTTRAGHQFVQTYSLAKGLKEFGSRGKEAAMKEMRQLHERMVFQPIMISELSPIERTRAMESLIFLAEKRDGSIKGRTCANGSNQRSFIQRDEAASPTAITESILLTALIDANEHRDVMTADIPNAFVQTKIDPKEKTERITMRIRGVMVDMLLEIDKERYAPYIIEEKGKQKTLYVIMLKALYGMLQSALWFYKRFRKDIEQIGFVINPYDPCVANRLVNGKQHTITWHVDDVKSSHQDPSVNDEFFHWLNAMYASDGIGEVKAVRGKKHDYLGIILNFEQPGTLVLDMSTYIDRMISEYPAQLTGVSKCPWTDSLYRVDQSLPLLQENKAKAFHTFVMKGMFIAKRARQDILPAITFLATRVTEPNEGDWRKLTKVMNFLKATMHHVTTLRMSNDSQILWFVDAAFAVHRDMKSHTGAVMSMGQGCGMLNFEQAESKFTKLN